MNSDLSGLPKIFYFISRLFKKHYNNIKNFLNFFIRSWH